MKHLLLLGEYEISFDEKNRFLVPADIRKRMDPDSHGRAFYLVIGTDRRPWMYPERTWEEIVATVPTELNPGRDRLAFDRRMFGTASHLEPDKQGRVLIPEAVRRRTGLDKEVTLVGVRDHLELWNRSDWEAERERLFAGTN